MNRLLAIAIHYAHDFEAADRPIDRRAAHAALDAYADAAHIVLELASPFEFKIAALDAVRAEPYPPQSPSNQARKDWYAAAEARLADALNLEEAR